MSSKLVATLSGGALVLLGAPAFIAPLSPNTNAPNAAAAQAQLGSESASAASKTSATQLAGMSMGIAAVATAMVGGRSSRRGKAVVVPTSQTALSAMPKQMEGTGGPMPDDVWDPLGLSTNASEEQLLRWRAVELKHGRVCMLACLGWWHNASGAHPIGDSAVRQTLSDDPLVAASQMPMAAMWQVVFTIMCIEWLFTYVCVPPKNRPWDLFGWEELITEEGQEDKYYKESQLQELNNGRLAMIGFMGLLGQDLATEGENIGKLGYNFNFPEVGDGWPVNDPRFTEGSFLAQFGGFNNFLLYADGINPFADQVA